MMIRIFFILCLMFSSALAADKIPEDKVLRGNFTEDRINPEFKTPLHSEGSFVIAPSQGLLWKADKPFQTVTAITPGGITQDINGKKAMSLESSKIPFLSRLYAMIGGVLAGDWSMLEKDFTVKREGDGHKWHVALLSLNSENKEIPFEKIEVWGGKFANKVILSKKDGGTHVLQFKNQKLSPLPLSKNEIENFEMVNP